MLLRADAKADVESVFHFHHAATDLDWLDAKVRSLDRHGPCINAIPFWEPAVGILLVFGLLGGK